MTALHLTLPLPPSVNHSTRRHTITYTKNGKTCRRTMDVPNAKADKWMAQAKDICVDEMKRTGWVCRVDEKVVVDLTIHWPDRRRRDCHNLTGIIANCLEGVAVNDDRWMLVRIRDFDVVGRGNECVDVTVRRAE